MKIAISGTTGFLGSKVANMFSLQGHEVFPLNRADFSEESDLLASKLDGAEVIIHLAGAPVIKRWTNQHRRDIWESRILTTRKLVDAMGRMEDSPRLFICASAVGIYSDEGRHDEDSTFLSDGFLGRVCRDWEAEAAKAPESCRTVMMRLGIILGKDGGALKQMLPPFRLGLGGRIGTGRQSMSWVHIEDVLGILQFLVGGNSLEGPVNVVSPEVVSNRTFTKVLAKTLGRPAIVPVPGFALRLVFGGGASTLTGGQHAIPARLMESGYVFRFPVIKEALHNILKEGE
ncbi:MAG: TIGR01777 family protein [Bacteroidia bacterium]|nr:MAG: TIGR01777 family protein [Bacteroidia bacterium]